MIYINAAFDKRPDAEAFAKEIEDAYPPDRFETKLEIKRIPTPGSDDVTFLVAGSRNERPS